MACRRRCSMRPHGSWRLRDARRLPWPFRFFHRARVLAKNRRHSTNCDWASFPVKRSSKLIGNAAGSIGGQKNLPLSTLNKRSLWESLFRPRTRPPKCATRCAATSKRRVCFARPVLNVSPLGPWLRGIAWNVLRCVASKWTTSMPFGISISTMVRVKC